VRHIRVISSGVAQVGEKYIYGDIQMGILDIDYDNLTVTKGRVKDRIVYTIDNFYKYPRSLVNKFNSAEHEWDIDAKAYPGKRKYFHSVLDKSEVEKHLEDVRKCKNVI